jgi:hypothetical protein
VRAAPLIRNGLLALSRVLIPPRSRTLARTTAKPNELLLAVLYAGSAFDAARANCQAIFLAVTPPPGIVEFSR